MPFDRRTWDRTNYQQKKEQVFALLGDCCSECGEVNNLHVHHLDPTTKQFTITKSLSRSWNTTLEELKGCVLLCAPCHRQKHATTHGKLRMYNNGCRCDKCRSVWNEKCKIYRERYRTKKRAALQSGQTSGMGSTGQAA